MIGAIIGDTVGSRFKAATSKQRNLIFSPPECFLNDDSIMTLAVAEAVMNWIDDKGKEKKDYDKLCEYATRSMRKWGKKYPR